MAKRGYRMTPRRRAALHKAQLASARKRRRARIKSGAKAVGAVAGSIAVAGLVHHANRAVTNPRAFSQDIKDLHGFARRGFRSGPKVDPNAPGVSVTSRKPVKYYGRGRARHIKIQAVHGSRIRAR